MVIRCPNRWRGQVIVVEVMGCSIQYVGDAEQSWLVYECFLLQFGVVGLGHAKQVGHILLRKPFCFTGVADIVVQLHTLGCK